MPIFDLGHRLTQNYDDYYKLNKSSDSLIYVENRVILDSGLASIDLTVGEYWFNCSENAYYEIPDDGLNLKQGVSAVIATKQTIGMPANVFGLVTGKGKYIFQGILISSGKINPGFFGELRVGLYNGGDETAVFKKGDAFCSSCFFQLESNLDAPPRTPLHIEKRKSTKVSTTRRTILFYNKHWGWILTIIIALIALSVSIYGTFFNK